MSLRCFKLSVVVHTCNSSTGEAAKGVLWVHSHLGYVLRLCLKNKNKNKKYKKPRCHNLISSWLIIVHFQLVCVKLWFISKLYSMFRSYFFCYIFIFSLVCPFGYCFKITSIWTWTMHFSLSGYKVNSGNIFGF